MVGANLRLRMSVSRLPVVGEREFYGLSFEVTPAVLIPRPETELLVELALQYMPADARVLDLGTGSGAIAIALAHAQPDAIVTALDASPAALAVAWQCTTAQCGRRIAAQRLVCRALRCAPIRRDCVNPPYMAGDPHLAQGDLRSEPAGLDRSCGWLVGITHGDPAPCRIWSLEAGCSWNMATTRLLRCAPCGRARIR